MSSTSPLPYDEAERYWSVRYHLAGPFPQPLRAAVAETATVAQKQQQLTDLSHTLLGVINMLVLSLTALFLGVAAAQVLLIYVCWQYP